MVRCLKIIENQSYCTIHDAANTKALISRELTAQLICIFHAKIRFSHHVAIIYTRMRVVSKVIRNLSCQIRAECTTLTDCYGHCFRMFEIISAFLLLCVCDLVHDVDTINGLW